MKIYLYMSFLAISAILTGCAMDQEKASALVSAINAANTTNSQKYNDGITQSNQQLAQLQAIQRSAQIQQFQASQKSQCDQLFEQYRLQAMREGIPTNVFDFYEKSGCGSTRIQLPNNYASQNGKFSDTPEYARLQQQYNNMDASARLGMKDTNCALYGLGQYSPIERKCVSY